MITLPDSLPTKRPRAQANSRRRDWYRIEAKAAEVAEVYIYDEIGYWGLTAKDFVKELGAVKASAITLHLNTPGGDVFDGIAIHNALRAHPAPVNVVIDSLAASIGSVIAMAGDSITMAKHSMMMIHDPFGAVLGNAADMRQMADVLDQLGDTIAGVYAERAGGTVSEWRARMYAETWYTDRQAVEAGLASKVDGDAEAEPTNQFDLSIYKNPPADLLTQAGEPEDREPTKRDVERALRDAGLSRSQAKAFVAKAWPEVVPDGEQREAADLEALRDALRALIT